MKRDWCGLMFLANDKCECGGEGVFQSLDEKEGTVLYYCPLCEEYFSVDLMEDPMVKKHLAEREVSV